MVTLISGWREEASRTTAEQTQGEEPLIPMPALTLDALRRTVAVVAPSRLPEFFQAAYREGAGG